MADARLLFDDGIPRTVSAALRELGVAATHLGHDKDRTPARAADDTVLLAHAKSTESIVVTASPEMVLLCAEQKVPVVWLDPVGRPFTIEELVPLVFLGAADWQERLAARQSPSCVRVRRSSTEVLALDRAARLSEQRLRAPKVRDRRAQDAEVRSAERSSTGRKRPPT